jgi:hypothetical protein
MKSKLIIILIFLLGTLASCTKDTVKPTVLPSTTTAVKLSTDLQPLFSTNCAVSGCHDGNNMDPNLTAGSSYTAIMDAGVVDTTNPSNSTLYKKVNTGGSMANYANPTFASKVFQWIQEGAKNN